MKIVCLIGGPYEAALREIAEGVRPRTEFSVLAMRHAAELVQFSVGGQRSGLAGRLSSLLGRQLDLLKRPAQREVWVALGEDIGYRVGMASIFAFRARPPILILFHGHALGSRRNRIYLRVLRRLRRIHWLPLSSALGDRLVDEFRVPADRVHRTGYGVDHVFFDASQSAGIGVASAGLASRDYKTLLDAVGAMDVPVRIAADSAWFKEVVDIGDAALAPHVDLSSAGDYRGLRRVYEEAQVVVVPMKDVDHACGYAVIYEALAMKRPVVATRTRAPSDVVVDGKTGLLVPPADAAALKGAIERLQGDQRLADALASAGRKAIVDSHTLESFTDRIVAVARAAVAAP